MKATNLKISAFLLFFILIGIGCLFTLSQCDKIENQDSEIFPIDTWDYSKVALIARITDNSPDWSLCIMDKSGVGVRKIADKTVACQKTYSFSFRDKIIVYFQKI